ncbi:MAG: hypothetical protein ACOX5R_06360 [bacterium]|jgi:hypothetical protein
MRFIKSVILMAIVVLLGVAFVQMESGKNPEGISAQLQTSFTDLVEWSRSKSPEFQAQVDRLVTEISSRMAQEESAESGMMEGAGESNLITPQEAEIEEDGEKKSVSIEELQMELGRKFLESQLKNMNEEEVIQRLETMLQVLKKNKSGDEETSDPKRENQETDHNQS